MKTLHISIGNSYNSVVLCVPGNTGQHADVIATLANATVHKAGYDGALSPDVDARITYSFIDPASLLPNPALDAARKDAEQKQTWWLESNRKVEALQTQLNEAQLQLADLQAKYNALTAPIVPQYGQTA